MWSIVEKIVKIEINRYRGLKDVVLDNLSRINVLVGENNSGKTSILEAIQLLSDPFSKVLLFETAIRRFRMLLAGPDSHMGELLKWIFPQGSGGHKPIELTLHQADKQIPVSFELVEQEFVDVNLLINSRGSHFTSKSGLPTKIEQKVAIKVADDDELVEISGKFPIEDMPKKNLYKVTHIIDGSAFRVVSADQVGTVILDQKKDELIAILKQFDHEITGIEIIPFFESTQVYIQKNNKELMPLSSFGDGLQKVVYVASKLLSIQDGVLLLDEAEVGIHTKMIPTFFEWLSKLAEEHNVTIFMTTHSLEAVDGVLAANEKSLENVSFYRLEENKVKRFSGERMYGIRYDFGMEVRG